MVYLILIHNLFLSRSDYFIRWSVFWKVKSLKQQDHISSKLQNTIEIICHFINRKETQLGIFVWLTDWSICFSPVAVGVSGLSGVFQTWLDSLPFDSLAQTGLSVRSVRGPRCFPAYRVWRHHLDLSGLNIFLCIRAVRGAALHFQTLSNWS